MLRDKCVLNQFECMMIGIVLDERLSSREVRIIREDPYVLVCVHVMKELWFNFVMYDLTHSICGCFKTMVEPLDTAYKNICENAQQIRLFIDFLVTHFKTYNTSRCIYEGETVPLLAEKLQYNMEYCAIVNKNKLQFVPRDSISPLLPLITEEEPIELNKYQTNKRIKGIVKSDDEMKSYGFRYIDSVSRPYWVYFSMLHLELHIEFSIRLFPDSDDVQIDVLDDDFCQPYDYQAMMDAHPYSVLPRKIFHEVDRVMHDLQNSGFITGYSTGMYV